MGFVGLIMYAGRGVYSKEHTKEKGEQVSGG